MLGAETHVPCRHPPPRITPPHLRARKHLCAIRRQGRDPRFEPARSQADKDMAAKRYSFVYDDVLPNERKSIKDKLKVRAIVCFKSAVVC